MTMWDRVANWEDLIVAITRISVGRRLLQAALGDILPGESSGDDIVERGGDSRGICGVGDGFLTLGVFLEISGRQKRKESGIA